MLTTRQAVLRKFWHAVMPLAALRDGPQPFTLLGERIVLFLDEGGAPAALKDRCCHRTAQLSKGWCPREGALRGKLQCGYHGWTYDRDGRVVHIPQYGAERPIPAEYATPAYRCTARYGYAWVALEAPIAEIPPVPEFDDPALPHHLPVLRDLAYEPGARARKQLRQFALQLRASRDLRDRQPAGAEPLRVDRRRDGLPRRDRGRRRQPGEVPAHQRQQRAGDDAAHA